MSLNYPDLFFSQLSLPLQISQRTFFPGKSFFFWLLIGLAFYVFYLYSKSKNKKVFLNSPYILSVSACITMLFISFVFMNVFLTDPPLEVVKVVKEKTVQELLKEDQKLLEEVEANFTQSSIHYNYLKHHFLIPSQWTENFDEITRDDFTILNVYYDHLESEDPDYSNNAKLGLGITYFHKDSLLKSLGFLNAISDKKFPYANYYQAKIYVKLADTSHAIAHFKAASEVNDRLRNESSYELIRLMDQSNRHDELYTLLNSGFPKKYFSTQLLNRLYFLNNQFVQYFTLKVKHAFIGFKWTGFIAALIILLIWGFYMTRMDLFEKESGLILFLVLVSGMCFTIFCFYLYDVLKYTLGFTMHKDNLLVYSIFGIGAVEELCKIMPLLILLSFGNRIVSEPYDYILYAAVSALGFSFMENIIYFDGDLNGVIHGRALTSVPGHIVDSSIVAYGLVLARYRYKYLPSLAGFALFFLLGSINHGLYDYWLFTHMHFMFLLGFVVSISVWIIIINNCLNNSPSFNYLTELKSNNIQVILSMSLLGVLIMEYALVVLENGPSYANQTFNRNLIISGLIITYYSSRLTNMDLVKGYWATIPLRNVGEKKYGMKFQLSNFLLRLLSGDTFSHSFVRTKIVLQAEPGNQKLASYFNQPVQGIISDRSVVTCVSSNGDAYEDPYWFRIDIAHPVNVGGSIEQTFLFRFEESRPSFETENNLVIYLFAFKDLQNPMQKLKRENLRGLGRALIKKE